MPTSDTPGVPAWFIALWVLMGVFLLIGIGLAIWHASVLRKGGLNPLIAEEQLKVQLAQNLRNAAAPTSGQPAKTTEERLAELEVLYERGVITAEGSPPAAPRSSGGYRVPAPEPTLLMPVERRGPSDGREYRSRR